MSHWFWSRKRAGKRSLFSINFPIIVVVAFFGFLVALLMPLVASCRSGQ